jgi:hypothetical protein
MGEMSKASKLQKKVMRFSAPIPAKLVNKFLVAPLMADQHRFLIAFKKHNLKYTMTFRHISINWNAFDHGMKMALYKSNSLPYLIFSVHSNPLNAIYIFVVFSCHICICLIVYVTAREELLGFGLYVCWPVEPGGAKEVVCRVMAGKTAQIWQTDK